MASITYRIKKARMQTIGERLRFARELRRYGVRELARTVGITSAAVTWFEADKGEPTLATLRALAAALRVSVVWLTFGEGLPPEETEEDRQRQPPRRGRPPK
jgi:transcriptional regulator with XRE-family HTH domain